MPSNILREALRHNERLTSITSITSSDVPRPLALCLEGLVLFAQIREDKIATAHSSISTSASAYRRRP